MAEAQSTLFEDLQKQIADYRKWMNPEGHDILKDMLAAGGPNGDPAAMERVVGNVGGAGGIKNVGGKIARKAGESILSWYQRIKQAGNAGKAGYAAGGTRRADIAGQVAKENARVANGNKWTGAGGGGGTVPLAGGPQNRFLPGGRQMMQDAQVAAAKDARFRTGEKVAAGAGGVAVMAGFGTDGFYTEEERQARVFEGNKRRLQEDNERLARGERSALAPDKRAAIEAQIAGVTPEDMPGNNVPQYGPDDPQGENDPTNMVEHPMVIPVPPPPRQASPNPDPITAARDLAQGQQKEAIIQKMRNAYYGQNPYYDDTLNPTDNFRAGLDAFGQAPRQFRRR